MHRRDFVRTVTAATGLAIVQPLIAVAAEEPPTLQPLPITMWEFSWLERRWPGAGYEDWDKALRELKLRGYSAVRIDPFPHLLYNDPIKKYGLNPHWDNQLWGSPFYNEVQVLPALTDFLRVCKKHKVAVGLSTWWREDTDETIKKIASPQDLGKAWQKTLDIIRDANLLDVIFFVDLSNEYSIGVWTPYLPKNTPRSSAIAQRYMTESKALLQAAYPDIPFCYSITSEFEGWQTENTAPQDLLELHIWIANSSDFNKEVGYNFQQFGHDDYKNLQLNAEKVYRQKEAHWLAQLKARIELCAAWSRKAALPVVTTECWGPIDYKDMPLLKWDWVKEACAYGTRQAAATGRWLGIATSNFCGPQFPGMWSDVAWHQNLTKLIRQSKVDEDLLDSKLAKRMKAVLKNN